MSIVALLALTVLLCAALAIVTDRPGRRRWHYVFKPLTTLLIIAILWVAPVDAGARAHLLIGCGLALSLVGDVMLMLPGDRFVPGLAAFALAQACYLVAFLGELPPHPSPWSALPYLAFAALISALLWGGADRLRAPVTVYALLLTAMAWAAGARYSQLHSSAAQQGWIGALCFVLSDSLLALDRFRHPIRDASMWVLALYYAAQLLIALSA